jgi:type IV secretion system protein VirB10
MTPPLASPQQPVGRNWRSIGIAVGVATLCTAAFVWYSVMGKDEEPAQRAERTDFTHSQATLPARSFEVGYRLPEPVPPPPVAAPVTPMPAQAPARPATKPVETKPPKPMLSMFATTPDPTAFQPTAERDGAGMPARLPAEYRPGASDGIDRLEADQRQGLSAQKNRWLASAGTNGDDFVTQPYQPPISRYMLQASTIIRAVTLNEVNSDLPGDVAAIITEDVRDTPTGDHVLIPAAAKLYGRYNDQLSYGQRRAQISWTRILFPDGSSQNIGSMAGADGSGAAGIEGEVDRHWGAKAGTIGGTALFTVLGQAGAILRGDGGNTNIGVVGAGAAGDAASQVGSQLITRELNRPNTLIIPQGSSVAVMLSKDLALPPYAAHTWARR